jgi:hypothetical protein
MSLKKWLALGGVASLSSFLVYNFAIKTKGKLQTLVILTEKKMLEVFSRIKAVYRSSFAKHQKQFRHGRRKLQRNSPEYAAFVSESYANLPKVFNEAVEEVLKEFDIPKEVYENSWRLLKSEENIFEAHEDLKFIAATGHPRNELQVDTIRDALEFCKSKLENEFSGAESLQLAVSFLEDELKDTYGFEIEEFERGYYAYFEGSNEYDSIFQAIMEVKANREL